MIESFRKGLKQWYEFNKRSLPWRQTKNPYLIWLSEIILQQTGVEIFFMDWEKTRGKLANTKDAKGKAQQAPISAWRTFFVANEWNELQSQRRINVPFTIVTMLFFLVGCGWQYHATRTPKMDDLTPAPIDPMLRFVNVAGLWLVIELIQIIYLA